MRWGRPPHPHRVTPDRDPSPVAHGNESIWHPTKDGPGGRVPKRLLGILGLPGVPCGALVPCSPFQRSGILVLTCIESALCTEPHEAPYMWPDDVAGLRRVAGASLRISLVIVHVLGGCGRTNIVQCGVGLMCI